MTTQPELVKQSDLLNQLVINRDTMEELGRIETLWMYAPSHRVLGFVSKKGFLGGKRLAFKLSQVVALGENGILTHAAPEETNAEKVRQLESVIHCEVWSESGQKIGKVTDYEFNLRTGEIAHYLFLESDWGSVTGGIYQLFPTQVLNIGHSRVLIPDYVVNNLSVYREGVKQKLTKATESLKEEYTQVVEEIQSLGQRAQSTTDQAKNRLRNLTGQLKQRAQSFSQQTRETVQSFNEQFQEETQQLVEQAREKSHTWLEQVREQTQTLGDQMEDGIQTLTVQAREILDSEEDELPVSPQEDVVDDPDDFFDALFRDQDDRPISPPPAPPVATASTDVPPVPEDTWENLPPNSSHYEPIGSLEDLSLEDDIWETAPDIVDSPPPPPTEPSTTDATTDAATDERGQTTDEPWV